MENNTTHFGFQAVDTEKKQGLVRDVFDSVVNRYDLMNDVLSMGLHRLWKNYVILHSGLQSGDKVLDLAGGTGDMARRFAHRVGASGQIILSDINIKMLTQGRKNTLNQGITCVQYAQLNAEYIPLADDIFDCVCIAFGLRNMTHKNKAIAEAHRVLKVGGRLLVLEFSQVENECLSQIYDAYSFNVMPKLGGLLTGDEYSYQYLAESIRKHPNQVVLKTMFVDAGFSWCEYHNLSGGIVALHKGIKS